MANGEKENNELATLEYKALLDKRRDGIFHERQISNLKRQWEQCLYNPLTYVVIFSLMILFLCYGVYFSWDFKCMIYEVYSYVLTVFGTLATQYIITNVMKKKNP
jgi:hypothetical protein